jgi:hypothetical protein
MCPLLTFCSGSKALLPVKARAGQHNTGVRGLVLDIFFGKRQYAGIREDFAIPYPMKTMLEMNL